MRTSVTLVGLCITSCCSCASIKETEIGPSEFRQLYEASPRCSTGYYDYQGAHGGFHRMTYLSIRKDETFGPISTYVTKKDFLPKEFPEHPQGPIQHYQRFDGPGHLKSLLSPSRNGVLLFSDAEASELAEQEIARWRPGAVLYATRSDYCRSHWILRFDEISSRQPILWACVDRERGVLLVDIKKKVD